MSGYSAAAKCLLPTLYAPTISISDDTLTITPNSNNGAFVTGYKIYVDNALLDTTTSTTYDLSDELTEIGTYEIYVTAYATLFVDSEPSNIEEYVIEPVPTGPKAFAIGDVLPATTRLRISWYTFTELHVEITTDSNNFNLAEMRDYGETLVIDGNIITDGANENFKSPYTDGNGNHAYIDLDVSTWSLEKRTVYRVYNTIGHLSWEDLNA